MLQLHGSFLQSCGDTGGRSSVHAVRHVGTALGSCAQKFFGAWSLEPRIAGDGRTPPVQREERFLGVTDPFGHPLPVLFGALPGVMDYMYQLRPSRFVFVLALFGQRLVEERGDVGQQLLGRSRAGFDCWDILTLDGSRASLYYANKAPVLLF